METTTTCPVHGTYAGRFGQCGRPQSDTPRKDGQPFCDEHAALFPDRKPRAARPRCKGHNVRYTFGADRRVPCTAYAGPSGYCRNHQPTEAGR